MTEETIGKVVLYVGVSVVLVLVVLLILGVLFDAAQRSSDLSQAEKACRPEAHVADFTDYGKSMTVCSGEDGGYVVKEFVKVKK